MCFFAVAVECYGTLLLSLPESFIRVTDRIVLARLSKWKTCRKFYADLWLIFVFSLCGLSFLCFFLGLTNINTTITLIWALHRLVVVKCLQSGFCPYLPSNRVAIYQFLPCQTLVLSTQMMVFDLSLLTFLSLCFVFPVVHSWHCS